MIRRLYVSAVRGLRKVLRGSGGLAWLESRDSGLAMHIRSLFSIYDAQDLASLDLPWWTYKAADQAEAFLDDHNEARVFEYGAGASTLWLSKRAATVVSVEHDREFAQTMTTLLADSPNVELHVVEPQNRSPATGAKSRRKGHRDLDFDEYVNSIDSFDGDFDMIIIDGRARVACLQKAVDRLAADGLLIFDDILRRRYRAARQVRGLRLRVTFGWTPTVPLPTSTGLFYRRSTP